MRKFGWPPILIHLGLVNLGWSLTVSRANQCSNADGSACVNSIEVLYPDISEFPIVLRFVVEEVELLLWIPPCHIS